MQKILLNGCFGGFTWSYKAIDKILERKKIKVEYCIRAWGQSWAERTNVSREEFLNATHCDHYFETEDKNTYYSGDCFSREDPDAIAVFEEYGSKFCSGDYSQIYMEEYDETLYRPKIQEYDGAESLELLPHLTEQHVRECNSIEDLIDLLRKIGVVYE